jgi:hypothetical protein
MNGKVATGLVIGLLLALLSVPVFAGTGGGAAGCGPPGDRTQMGAPQTGSASTLGLEQGKGTGMAGVDWDNVVATLDRQMIPTLDRQMIPALDRQAIEMNGTA